MEVGKTIRMARLFNRSGRLFDIALDHGIAYGVLPGIENVRKAIQDAVEGGADAVTLHKGNVVRFYREIAGRISLVIKCTSFSAFHPTYDTWVTDVEEAVRLGADAIAVGVIIGDERQAEMVRNLGLISKQAFELGMPLICHIYPKGGMVPEEERYKVEHIIYAARIAAELGVDVIKTWYTGSPDSFKKVIEAVSPVKVVIAGGPKADNAYDILKKTEEVMSVGACGVTFGRNVWQYHEPRKIAQALKTIIHEKKSAQEAYKFLE